MKVVSGSLDVLETVGKKTFDVRSPSELDFIRHSLHFQQVINEADPDLKGTRRLLNKQNRPTLSEVNIPSSFFSFYSPPLQIIREAQLEKDFQSTPTSNTINEPMTFFQLFEQHQGKTNPFKKQPSFPYST